MRKILRRPVHGLLLVLLIACSQATDPEPGGGGTQEEGPLAVRIESSLSSFSAAYTLEGSIVGGADVTGITLSIADGPDTPVEPATRSFAVPLTLQEGTTLVRVTATDAEGAENSAEAFITYVSGGGVEPTGPTSEDLIDEALQSGAISEVDALRYKVFAVFGDDRLPEPYASEVELEGTPILLDLVETIGDLPADVQLELEPFLLPPSAPGSWYDLRSAGPLSAQTSHLFDSIDVADGDARISWPANIPALRTDAEKVAEIFDEVWEKLTTLMDQEPLSDALFFEDYNGGDGAFDVYIVGDGNVTTQDLQTAYGWSSPYSLRYPGQGDNARATYLVMNRDRIATASIGFEKKLASNLAHEFMHALQFAFDVTGSGRGGFGWLAESTATWAEHYVWSWDDPSKDYDSEHEDAAAFLDHPKLTLSSEGGDAGSSSNHEYGAYLYWFYLSKRNDDPGIVRRVWELGESFSSLEAADRATPGGFDGAFEHFTVANWNDDPVSTHPDYEFYRLDGLTDTVDTSTDKASLSGQQQTFTMSPEDGGVARLSAQYLHFTEFGGDTRSLIFANGFTYDLSEGVPQLANNAFGVDETFIATPLTEEVYEGRRVYALVKQDGAWLDDPWDLSDVAFVPFCQDYPSESVEEIVFIFINAEHDESRPFRAAPTGLAPRLFTSNMACGDWVGSASVDESFTNVSSSRISSVGMQNLRFTRTPRSIENLLAGAGQTQVEADGTVIPAAVLEYQAPGMSLVEANFDWSATIQQVAGDETCQASGGGSLGVGAATGSRLSIYPLFTGTTDDATSSYRSFMVSIGVQSPSPLSGSCTPTGRSVEVPWSAVLAGGFRDPATYQSSTGLLTVSTTGDSITESWKLSTPDGEANYSLNLTPPP